MKLRWKMESLKPILYFPEPLTFYGEGSYALSAVKEIDGTEEFLRLDEGVKNCQSRETFQDCQAREYVRKGLARCGCVPFQIRTYARHVSSVMVQPYQALWLKSPPLPRAGQNSVTIENIHRAILDPWL